MKKISPPKSELPERYQQALAQAKSENDAETEVDISEPEPVFESVQFESKIPPREVHHFDLKRLKSFKQIRQKYKQSNASRVFVKDLSIVLDEYDPSEHQLDTELLVLVLDIAESYFVYGSKEEREQMKAQSVKTLMLRYFRDEAVLDKMISSVWHKVKKSTWVKRMYRRLLNRFFFLK
jgi:hypothetical protein